MNNKTEKEKYKFWQWFLYFSWFYDIIYYDVTIEIDHTAHLNEPSRVESSRLEFNRVCLRTQFYIFNNYNLLCCRFLICICKIANLQPQLMSCIFSSCSGGHSFIFYSCCIYFVLYFIIIIILFNWHVYERNQFIVVPCHWSIVVDDDVDIEIAMNSIIYKCNLNSLDHTILINITIIACNNKKKTFNFNVRIEPEPYKTLKICSIQK